MDLEKIKQIGKCCITEEPLHTSEEIILVQLGYKATWSFPIWGNIITGQQSMAFAIIHDCAVNEDGNLVGPIRFAIECTEDDIIYHPLESLQKVEIIKPPDHTSVIEITEPTAHPCLQMQDAAGVTHQVEYRQYQMSPQQQFAVLGINRDLVPIEIENLPGLQYDFMGKLEEQGAIFHQQIVNSLMKDYWDFETWPNPEILLITKK